MAWVAVTLVGVSVAGQSQAQVQRAAAKVPAAYARAFFERSQLDVARAEARTALRHNPRNIDALFVDMEAAAMEADTPAVLQAAARILALPAARNDERAAIAAARVYDLAANTREFREVLPGLLSIGERANAQNAAVRAALVKAAMDGLRGVNITELTKAAGILTDWRAAGPFGEYPDLDFHRAWAPQTDSLLGGASDGHPVELFRFPDGMFRLPDYFAHDGVFYAMSQAHVAGGEYQLRVESAGTFEVYVDGRSVLRHDTRFRDDAAIASGNVRLKPGRHTVLVKFLHTALPFRVALTRPEPERKSAVAYAPEARYLSASLKFWVGDYAGAVLAFDSLRDKYDSAAAAWMLYQSWTHAEKDPPEAEALLAEVLHKAPEALIAEYEWASRDVADDRMDDALSRLSKVLGRRAYFPPAEELMGEIAVRMHLPVRAARSIEIQLTTHPSCSVLLRAQHFFTFHAQFDSAREVDGQLADCAVDSLAYARSLSESGNHEQAAAAAQKVVASNPLDRPAREMLAKELALAGNTTAAQTAIRQLAQIAPNSERYRRMAAAAARDPLTLLDASDAASAARDEQPFYLPYRRNGIQAVKDAADRHFSGGPALRILDDQIARLWPDGSVSLYVHRITRALDRGGVEKYGEVSVPVGAEVLNLRTIRADGSVIEPELTPDKVTVSMPGFLPGDAIDEEYVFHYPAEQAALHTAFAHTFGSFDAPVLFSRFIALTPAADEERVAAAGDAPGMVESTQAGLHVRIWEEKDIPQSVEEVASARGDILPTVRLSPVLERGWEDVRDDEREIAIQDARVGPRVLAAVQALPSGNDEERARALYRLVTTSIRSTTTDFNVDTPSAEQTLLDHAGSRTAALLAMANAAGLDADLVLTRDAGIVNAEHGPDEHVYTRPLVRFHFDDTPAGAHDLLVDAESDGLAFGALPPAAVRGDALAVTLPNETQEAKVEPAILQLPEETSADQSVARADITLDPSGNMTVDMSIVFGAWRGSEMRSTLADSVGSDRKAFFQQLATRIFPGAEDATGEVRNEDNSDRTLEITLHCSVPDAVDLSHGRANLQQLVPELGLKRMYPATTERQFPLFVSTPMVETTTFRIHLPAGVAVVHPAADFHAHSQFGSYSVSFREPQPGVLEVKRAFDVPVQVITPAKFAEFAQFASQIDHAEQQKIGLGFDRTVARAGQ